MNERIQAAIDAAMGAVNRISQERSQTAIRQAIENVALVAAREKRAEMLARDASMETYLLYGCIEKANGEKWTEQEGREFSERFLTWMKAQELGYAGLLGEPKELEENMHSKRDAD